MRLFRRDFLLGLLSAPVLPSVLSAVPASKSPSLIHVMGWTPTENQTSVHTIAGGCGSGKTTLGLHLANAMVRRGDSVLYIHDGTDSYWNPDGLGKAIHRASLPPLPGRWGDRLKHYPLYAKDRFLSLNRFSSQDFRHFQHIDKDRYSTFIWDVGVYSVTSNGYKEAVDDFYEMVQGRHAFVFVRTARTVRRGLPWITGTTKHDRMSNTVSSIEKIDGKVKLEQFKRRQPGSKPVVYGDWERHASDPICQFKIDNALTKL